MRDWLLITGEGQLQNGRGGASDGFTARKKGGGKVLAIRKGGTKMFGVVLT